MFVTLAMLWYTGIYGESNDKQLGTDVERCRRADADVNLFGVPSPLNLGFHLGELVGVFVRVLHSTTSRHRHVMSCHVISRHVTSYTVDHHMPRLASPRRTPFRSSWHNTYKCTSDCVCVPNNSIKVFFILYLLYRVRRRATMAPDFPVAFHSYTFNIYILHIYILCLRRINWQSCNLLTLVYFINLLIYFYLFIHETNS